MKKLSISEIDKNLSIESKIDKDDVVFIDVKSGVFDVYGLYDYKSPGKFKRMPDEVVEKIGNGGMKCLYTNTAGGRIRFSTNSKYIALDVKYPNMTVFPHMPVTGTSGFDLYLDESDTSVYKRSFIPPCQGDGFQYVITFDDNSAKNITINFPLYNDVSELSIGLQKDSFVGEGLKYLDKKPIVYYGSSITQGGCASRPGNAYQAIITRKLNLDHINLGFSGNARGEKATAEYIASLKMKAFVMDYDFNAENADALKSTHEQFYKIIREKNPDLPIIIVTNPDYDRDPKDTLERKEVIWKTFINAKKAGDENVYFIDGYALFGDDCRDSCTVDAIHPNDLGFYRMAEIIGGKLAEILKRGS